MYSQRIWVPRSQDPSVTGCCTHSFSVQQKGGILDGFVGSEQAWPNPDRTHGRKDTGCSGNKDSYCTCRLICLGKQ